MRPETPGEAQTARKLWGSSDSLGPIYPQLHGLRLSALRFFHQVAPLDKNGTLLHHLQQVRPEGQLWEGRWGKGTPFSEEHSGCLDVLVCYKLVSNHLSGISLVHGESKLTSAQLQRSAHSVSSSWDEAVFLCAQQVHTMKELLYFKFCAVLQVVISIHYFNHL